MHNFQILSIAIILFFCCEQMKIRITYVCEKILKNEETNQTLKAQFFRTTVYDSKLVKFQHNWFTGY